MRVLIVGALIVVGCGDPSKEGRDPSTDPACPAGYLDDDPAVPCSVLGQHCTGYENGAYCIGCAPGPYYWETDEVFLACDGGTSD
jgi:hypothetical protein